MQSRCIRTRTRKIIREAWSLKYALDLWKPLKLIAYGRGRKGYKLACMDAESCGRQ